MYKSPVNNYPSVPPNTYIESYDALVQAKAANLGISSMTSSVHLSVSMLYYSIAGFESAGLNSVSFYIPEIPPYT